MKRSLLFAALAFLAVPHPPHVRPEAAVQPHNHNDDVSAPTVDAMMTEANAAIYATDGELNRWLSAVSEQTAPSSTTTLSEGGSHMAASHSAQGSLAPSAQTGGIAAKLASIRACESGGNYSTNTGNGFYGAYQFTPSTWQAVTGLSGTANMYPASVQDAAAAKLYAGGAGAGNWPVCAYR